MRTYTQDVEIEIEDIIMDAEADLPVPACPVFCGTVTVTISGKDTPAILSPNDKAQPAEYREAETDKCSADLAWEVWTAYEKQVGPLSLSDRDAFLKTAGCYCNVAIDDARVRAMELDAEPPEPEFDTFRERDESYAD